MGSARDPTAAAHDYNDLTPEVIVLLALIAPALALTVPVRATFKETVDPGEPALASVTTTATVRAYSSTTGDEFGVSADELTANKREASGSGGLSFTASPAGSVRTWALYFIGADGEVLGDPEVVTLSFDSAGTGNAAAGTGSRLAGFGVSTAKARGNGQFFASTGRVAVQDSGANAAYIGIAELSSDGSALVYDPDLDAMDAAAFATFQAEGLDAILPLSNYTLQLEGNLTIDGLSVAADGTVEGGADVQWDVGFHTGAVVCQKGGTCEPVVSETLSWQEPIGAVKKKAKAAPRVNLRDTDVVFETYDAGLELSIAGDTRDLEVSAAMELYEGSRAVAASEIVTLDPSGLGVQAKKDKDDDDDDTGMIVDIFIDVDTDIIDDDRQGTTGGPYPVWAYFANDLYQVTLVDSGGGIVSQHDCMLSPTPGTVAGTSKRENLVGECTTDPSGTEVRRLLLSIGKGGYMYWKLDLASPAFAASTTTNSCKGTACPAEPVTALGGTVEISRDGMALYTGTLKVNETDFALPFTFADISDGLVGSVGIDVYTPDTATWTVKDGVATASDASGVIASFPLADVGLAATGDVVVQAWSAESATAPKAGEPLTLTTLSSAGQKIRLKR